MLKKLFAILYFLSLFTLNNAYSNWQKNIDSEVTNYLSTSNATAVSVLIGNKDQIIHKTIQGFAKKDNALTEDTLFDLASISKLFTATAIMILEQKGLLNHHDNLCKYFTEYCVAPKKKVTIESILRHRSGLPAWIDLENIKGDLRTTILKTPLKTKPNARFVYSDIGYIILGWLIEDLTQKTLDQFVYDEIFHPLNLINTQYNPNKNCVFTTNLKEECLVHDNNSRVLNGISGHAGIFSTATELQKFLQIFITENNVLNNQTIKLMTEKKYNEDRGLGFDISSSFSTWVRGDYFTLNKSFGHTGYTGTSLWVDHTGLYIIILTNRVLNGDTSLSKKQTLEFRKKLADIAGSANL